MTFVWYLSHFPALNLWIFTLFSGKFGAIFASIPAPIVAALYCLFFAYVGTFNYTKINMFFLINLELQFMKFYRDIQTGAVGLSYLQFCNLNSFRTKFILGFSIFMGLSVPQYFNEYTSVAGYGPVHTNARWVWKIIELTIWNNLLT